MAAVAKLRPARGVLEILSVFLIIGAAATYTPEDNYLLSCGSSVDTPVGKRHFLADPGAVTLTSRRSAAVEALPGSVPQFPDAALYRTARVFEAPSSYAFAIRRPGRHFLRLHFFPFANGAGYNLTAAARAFKVSTQDAVLLDNGLPVSTHNASSPAPVVLEFLLDVSRDKLIVTFVPQGADGGVAFVNAVEVISVPDDLVTAAVPLQTSHRVNVGGPAIGPEDDALWRVWTTDRPFLLDSFSDAVTREVRYNGTLHRVTGQATETDAPDAVYATARELILENGTTTAGMKQMAWQFDVDASSAYLIRFHFCDIVSKAPDQLNMNAYVDASTAIGVDLAAVGGGARAFPYYKDFTLPASAPSGKLAVYVGPWVDEIVMPAAVLNGVEIMKMHMSAGSVVVVQPGRSRLAVIVGSACGAFAFVSIAVVLVIVLRKKKKERAKEEQPKPMETQSSPPWIPLLGHMSIRRAIGPAPPSFSTDTDTPAAASPVAAAVAAAVIPSFRFPFAVLQEATRDFDNSLVVGEGGFGQVYAAVLPDGTKVAVKRASPESRQGAREFRTEIELLSGLRHRHLVSHVGYCDERDEMMLLYEFMEHGSLRSRLYGRGGAATPVLSWAQRLEACAGAARGLLYLHTAAAKPVIHRDVKSSNILLDGGLTAKVADFGLSRDGPELDETHVSTAVKGSYGYVDPEYCRTKRLTAKSDVYSFGVVLLEALCARPVVDRRLPRPMAFLVEWGLHWQGRGQLEKIVDRRIAGEVRPAALSKFGETVARCLAERGADRPAMEDVVWSLQFVMRLQEGDGLDVSDVNSLNMVTELKPPEQTRAVDCEAGSGEDGDDVGDGDFTDASMRGTFWKMVNVGDR